MSIQDEFPPEEELHLDSVLADHYTRLRARAVEMEKALQRLDPYPNEEIFPHVHPGAVYCEISVGDMRAIREALARP